MKPILNILAKISVFLCSLAMLLICFINPAPSAAAPDIVWTPGQVTESVSQGQSKSIIIYFTSRKIFTNVRVFLTPALDPFVGVNTVSFFKIEANKPVALSLTLIAGQNASLGSYYGTLQLKTGAKTIAIPLPIEIVVSKNSSPVANAGPDQSVFIEDIVELDGSGSTDADGDLLTYKWSFISLPANSAAKLSDAKAVSPTFLVDLPGEYIVQLIVNDGKTDSKPDTVVVSTGNTAPVANAGPDQTVFVNRFAQLNGSLSSDIDGDTISYHWSIISKPLGSIAALDDPNAVNPIFQVDEPGTYVLELIVSDGKADSKPDTVSINFENSKPVATAGPDLTSKVGDTVNLDGSGSSDVDGDTLTFNWSIITKPVGSTVNLTGPETIAPSFKPDAIGTYVIQLIVNDGLLNSDPDTAKVTVEVSGPLDSDGDGFTDAEEIAAGSDPYNRSSTPLGTIPPDPALVAPPLDLTVATSIHSATQFLYMGSNPIQTGMAPETIVSERVAVLHGRVFDRQGNGLLGVVITILGHPEYGQTLTRPDGTFDMVANGGGVLTVNYKRNGYLPAQRQIDTPWQDYVALPDVVLISLDTQVTAINLSSPEPVQVARGNVVTDASGARQATLLIAKGTIADMVLPDGSTQPLSSLTIRATEYTVGSNGPKTMPAELPPTSAYTYCVEIAADEAIAAGAEHVQFNKATYFYVDDFIGFPVGGIVPVGYYDRHKGQWVASENGKVIKVLGITGGLADIDTDGDNVIDTPTKLSSLGIMDAEREKLATLYTQLPKQLWRVPITHLSPFDMNWPSQPPEDAIWAEDPNPKKNEIEKDDPCRRSGGSVIDCQNQTLGETVGIVGSPFSLNYQSSRTPGRKEAYTLEIPLIGDTVPASLKQINVQATVAGRVFDQSYYPSRNLKHTFTWDGKDKYGRSVQGRQPVGVRLTYIYPSTYQQPASTVQSFGTTSGIPISGTQGRDDIKVSNYWGGSIGTVDFKAMGLGGWSLNVHHIYDQVGRILYLGDGSKKSAENIGWVISTVVGTGEQGFSGDGGPATEAKLGYEFDGVDIGPDGSIYIADGGNYRIRKVGFNGIINTIAGTGQQGYSGDGGPAINATFARAQALAIAPDGSLYIADGSRIRRIFNGIITTVAGTSLDGFNGDGIPATESMLNWPQAVAVAQDGTVYIADTYNNRIRRVGTDGIITTVAGTGEQGFSGDGGPAKEAKVSGPEGVKVSPDGTIIIADSWNSVVRRVGPNGIITTIAGTGEGGYWGDGGPATAAAMDYPIRVAIGPDGSLYITDVGSVVVRKVDPGGIISTIIGSGEFGFKGDGGPATGAALAQPWATAVGRDGSMYVVDAENNRLRKVEKAFPKLSADTTIISSADGSELYLFDRYGRHLKTLNALTGILRYEFSYDTAGRLASVKDGDNNITTIQQDASGDPLTITGPFGQQTTLGLDTNGYLASATNPAGESFQFSYSPDGLLLQTIDPRANIFKYTHDNTGRLIRYENPDGGYQTLARGKLSTGFEVTHTSAMGRVTTYRAERLSDGRQRMLNTLPGGNKVETIIKTDGSDQTILSDGTLTRRVFEPDPRFGMQVPTVKNKITTTPKNLSSSITTSSSVTLSDPTNLLSLQNSTNNVNTNGKTRTVKFDAALRRITHQSPEKRENFTTLDTLSRVAASQSTGLAPISYVYDSRGRVTGLSVGSGADARLYNFDYNGSPADDGLLDRITNPESLSLTFKEYDSAGRLKVEELPDTNVISMNYDPSGNLISLYPPGRPAHLFTYTPNKQLENYIPPAVGQGSGNTHFKYNLDQQLELITRPDGKQIEFAYGIVSGCLDKISVTESANEIDRLTFTYSSPAQASCGDPSSITTYSNETVQFTYDGFLSTSTSWAGTINGSVGRTFNNDFKVYSEIVNGGNFITFVYDMDGLLSQAGSLSLLRDDPANPQTKNGLLRGTAISNVVTSLNYNGFGELQDSVVTFTDQAQAVKVFETHYTNRDRLGRIKTKSETINGETKTYEYDYDSAGRLWKVYENSLLARQYSYDSNGNRLLFKSDGTLDVEYDNQDRMMRYGSTIYAFTPNGELQTKTNSNGQTNYTHDTFGNLKSVELPNSTTVNYIIDGKNRRIGKKVNGTLVQGFLYHSQLKPVAELDNAGNIISRFVYATSENAPDYMERAGKTYRIITDNLGSPRVVVEVITGVIEQRMDYDEFGNVLIDTNPGFQPFGFAGGLYDQHTKLTQFGARDYDASVGRWLAKDPVLFATSNTNLYAYTGNNPVNFIDPGGQCEEPWEGTVIIVVNNRGAVGGVKNWVQGEGNYNAVVCTGNEAVAYCQDSENLQIGNEQKMAEANTQKMPEVIYGRPVSKSEHYYRAVQLFLGRAWWKVAGPSLERSWQREENEKRGTNPTIGVRG
jgi:RHS repeat-associated protein